VAQFLDLTLAESADRAGQQCGHLGAERRRDLRRAREQEVAGEDGLQVAPLGVDGLDAAARGRFVHDVVVVQRTRLHEFAGDASLDSVVARRTVGDLCGHEGEHRAQALAAGDDEMGGDVVEIRIGRAHRLDERGLDAFDVAGHAREREERQLRHGWRG
jgi:hypothetical protein